MTDRELLEMAARAAGLDVVYKYGSHYLGGDEWWPLDDDGDALRLAVSLDITVAFWDYPQNAVAAYVSGNGVPARTERFADDKGAATRRAIVRAAAAIGAGLAPFPTAEQIREDWT